MGREPICKCGTVKLWHGVTMSSENSQHLSDWYSPSHVIHGFIFYGVLWLFARRAPLGVRLVAATLVEAAWEIDREYRLHHQPLPRGDDLARLLRRQRHQLGVRHPVHGARLLARRAAAGVADGGAGGGAGDFVGVMIRDNLTLNVIMLIWPLEAIRAWQAGG